MKSTEMADYKPPYISAGAFQEFLELLRKQNFEQIDSRLLQLHGYSSGNAAILLSTLRALNIIDSNGRPVDRQKFIQLSMPDERQPVLREIVDNFYADLMRQVEPANATVEQVKKFYKFRQHSETISAKAARFFLWIAEQAGYEVGERIEATKVKKRPAKTTSIQNDNGYAESDDDIEEEVQQTITHARNVLNDDKRRLLDILLRKMEEHDDYPPEAVLDAVLQLIEEERR